MGCAAGRRWAAACVSWCAARVRSFVASSWARARMTSGVSIVLPFRVWGQSASAAASSARASLAARAGARFRPAVSISAGNRHSVLVEQAPQSVVGAAHPALHVSARLRVCLLDQIVRTIFVGIVARQILGQAGSQDHIGPAPSVPVADLNIKVAGIPAETSYELRRSCHVPTLFLPASRGKADPVRGLISGGTTTGRRAFLPGVSAFY